MSRYWNGGQNHDIRRVNKPFENVKFKCLGMIGTNKNYIREEIKSRIYSGNICQAYHSPAVSCL